MQKKSRKLKPMLLAGIFPYNKGSLAKDIFAGVSLAALAIPIDMGYAKIAGMPVITGLYALLLPCVAFAIFGASRHLVVGADSASAAIMAAGLVSLAAPGSAEYASYAGLLAVMVGVLLLACRLLNLGFIAQFLSRTVLTGFLTGIGVQIAIGQLPELLGLSGISGNVFEKFSGIFSNIENINPYAIGVTAIVFAIMLLPRLFTRKHPQLKRIPWALIALAISIALGHGLQNVLPLTGEVQGGLPTLALPSFSYDAILALMGSAISIVVVVITQSEATASAFAERYKEKTRPNRDLAGLGAANIAAGISGSFAVNGSPSKTEIAAESGGTSQFANLTAAGVVLLVLLFLTGPLGFLPGSALAAVVFVTGAGLVDIRTMKKIYGVRKDEFYLALVTAAVVVLVGAAWGILLAIALSLLDHIHHSYKPVNAVFHEDPSDPEDTDAWKPVAAGVYAKPGIVIYHFGASLYYANASVFQKEIALVASASPPPSAVVIDFSAVADVDYTGSETIASVYNDLKSEGVKLSIVLIKPNVLSELDRYGVTALIGRENIYPSIRSMLEKVG